MYLDTKSTVIKTPGRKLRSVGTAAARLKRLLDVVLAVIALIALLPALLAIGVMMLIADGRPIFFKHERIGLGGRRFNCLKFRTMRNDAQARLQEILDSDEAMRIEWKQTQKLTNDPRIHWIGKMLRISSLDELPQLWNVVRGDMSLVGPRPVVADELSHYGSNAQYYLAMVPGITGLWQVSGRNDTSYKQRVALDVEYYHKQSVRLDLAIMLKTIPVLLIAQNGR